LVVLSEVERDNFAPGYFKRLYRWLDQESGAAHVAAYLSQVDLTGFDRHGPPPRTDGWHDMAAAGLAPEIGHFQTALTALGDPDVVTLVAIANEGDEDFGDYLKKNPRQVPFRMAECGYVSVRNPTAQKGLWKIAGRWQAVYAKKGLAASQRLALIREKYL
jgi:hypothetical protein